MSVQDVAARVRGAAPRALVLGLALLSACKSKAGEEGSSSPLPSSRSSGTVWVDAKAGATTPPDVRISFDTRNHANKILVDGIDGAVGDLRCTGPTCTLTIPNLPPGTKARLGLSEATVDARGKLPPIAIDLTERLLSSPTREVLVYGFGENQTNGLFDLGVKLELTFPDGVKIEGDLPMVNMRSALSSFLERAAKAGKAATLGPDDTSGTPGAILFFPLVLGELVGEAKTVRDIDRVAVAKDLAKRPGGRTCSGTKRGVAGGPDKALALQLIDKEVTIVERRTGKVLETKKFEAPPTCPIAPVGEVASSYPAAATMTAWVRTKL